MSPARAFATAMPAKVLEIVDDRRDLVAAPIQGVSFVSSDYVADENGRRGGVCKQVDIVPSASPDARRRLRGSAPPSACHSVRPARARGGTRDTGKRPARAASAPDRCDESRFGRQGNARASAVTATRDGANSSRTASARTRCSRTSCSGSDWWRLRRSRAATGWSAPSRIGGTDVSWPRAIAWIAEFRGGTNKGAIGMIRTRSTGGRAVASPGDCSESLHVLMLQR